MYILNKKKIKSNECIELNFALKLKSKIKCNIICNGVYNSIKIFEKFPKFNRTIIINKFNFRN